MPQFTEAETEFLAKAMTCMKQPPELDYNKLAEALGVKPKTVTNRWSDLKKKLFADGTNDGGEGSSPAASVAATPKKRKGRKIKGEDDDEQESPTKKPRSGGRKKAVPAPASVDVTPSNLKEENDDEAHDDTGIKEEAQDGDYVDGAL